MRITYRGNFGVSFSTETHIAKTLLSMGHEVKCCQENRMDWPEQLEACKDADLFLWTSTYDYGKKYRTGEAEAVQALNAMLPTAAVHLDRFWGLRRETWVEECGWFRLSAVFTADGDSEDKFKEAGVAHHWLMPGVFHEECELGTFDPKYESDIAFVGCHGFNEKTRQFSLNYHQEYRGRRQLVEWLHNTYGDRVKFWPKHRAHAVRETELANLYASVKVVVGDSCFADTSVNYTSDRPYETVGRGGFLVYPRIPCVIEELIEGEHFLCFEPGNWDALQLRIEAWLDPSNDEYRNAIRKAGSAYVRENCSYRQRMQAMLTTMGLG